MELSISTFLNCAAVWRLLYTQMQVLGKATSRNACVALSTGTLLFTSAESLSAQSGTARTPKLTIVGVVHDTLGAPIPGASIRNSRSGERALSDSNGRFDLITVRSASLALSVMKVGFPSLTLEVAPSNAAQDTVDIFLFGAMPRSRESDGGRADTVVSFSTSSIVLVPPSATSVNRSSTADSAVRAMRQPRMIRGVVTDTANRPLVGAFVSIVSEQRSALTDSAGRFVLTNLVPGAVFVRVRRVGYAPRSFATNVSAVDAVLIDIPLEALGQRLSRVTVQADGTAGNAKLRGFYERKQMGSGQFLTRDQFADRNPLRITDLMNRFSGVVSGNDGNGRRQIYGRGRCLMAFYLDGIYMNVLSNSSIDDFIDVYEIDAVEVHTSTIGMPPEFSGRTNGCGVIAAWTRGKSGR
jgi:Carboxypeptidase regulatory-like domain/TonB-dependent Receptor Plug Domain